MCLAVVNFTKLGKGNKIVSKGGRFIGYKSFSIEEVYNLEDNSYTGKYEIQPLYGMDKIPKIGQWIKADDSVIEGDEDEDGNQQDYTSGFHIFSSLQDAIDYQVQHTVFLVEFEDIVGIGKQSISNEGVTVIAKKMKLLRKISSDV